MSYRVLARTYRSGTFDELVGQQAIATTLKNAISSGRVHHGYLFTGTRGVGKTSLARILAKALNCLSFDDATTTPCCKCASCTAIAEGGDIDVVEIDAASNTGVDSIRELRGNAALRPARSRFKIYIIDEVHMLSTGAFNALLKTLEEPPPHVKFILATTEAHKVPATIQSRCQRFDFRAIDVSTISEHLRRITNAEKIKAEDAVLRRVARLANGSMRDALSLLDKLLSFEPSELTAACVDEVLPPPHDESASLVMQSVAGRDAAGALRALDQALQTGQTVDRFCDHLIEHVRTLMLLRVCGKDTELVDVAAQIRPELATAAEQFDGPTYVYMISLVEELRRNVKSSGAGRALADATIVQLAMSHRFTDVDQLIERAGAPSSSAPADSGRIQGSQGSRIASKTAGGKRADDPIVDASVARPGAKTGKPPVHERQPMAAVSPVDVPAPDLLQGSSSPSAPPATRVTAEDRRRVARDPFVQRVKEAVDGVLLDVLPGLRPPMAAEPSAAPEDSTPSQ